MKYYLLLWITGCVGFHCPIPDYLQEPYDSQEECERALAAMMKVGEMTKKAYAGICLPEDSMERIDNIRKEFEDSH